MVRDTHDLLVDIANVPVSHDQTSSHGKRSPAISGHRGEV
jgi:hypothetical protein